MKNKHGVIILYGSAHDILVLGRCINSILFMFLNSSACMDGASTQGQTARMHRLIKGFADRVNAFSTLNYSIFLMIFF